MTRSTVFAPFDSIEGDRSLGIVLVADHARRDLPDEYGDLGLPGSEFDRHIAYDIGVETVTRELAAQLGAPAVIANFSRLLIDPNRGEDDPTLIRQLYDGTVIPANYPMTVEERESRLENYYRPYHDAVGAMISSVVHASGAPPLIISVHSFTPIMHGQVRPWHVGILWDLDDRVARPLMDRLAADENLAVGDNEPYDGALRGDTMYRHAIVNGFAHALIEIRQDLIADRKDAVAWAERLAPIVEEINRRPDIHRGETVRLANRAGLTEAAMTELSDEQKRDFEAAAFRRLVEHLRERTDVQNIDLMNLAGFCRNCLSNWYREAASDKGIALSKDESREIIYGMPYAEWQALNQTETSDAKLAAFEARRPKDH